WPALQERGRSRTKDAIKKRAQTRSESRQKRSPLTNQQRTPSKPRPKANHKGWDTLPTTSQTTAGNDKSENPFSNKN
ncbi:unnamed protein product, partial [Ixodes persulcatus]